MADLEREMDLEGEDESGDDERVSGLWEGDELGGEETKPVEVTKGELVTLSVPVRVDEWVPGENAGREGVLVTVPESERLEDGEVEKDGDLEDVEVGVDV